MPKLQNINCINCNVVMLQNLTNTFFVYCPLLLYEGTNNNIILISTAHNRWEIDVQFVNKSKMSLNVNDETS